MPMPPGYDYDTHPLIYLGALRAADIMLNFDVKLEEHGLLSVRVNGDGVQGPFHDSDDILPTVRALVINWLIAIADEAPQVLNKPPAVLGFFCQQDWAELQHAAAETHMRRWVAAESPLLDKGSQQASPAPAGVPMPTNIPPHAH